MQTYERESLKKSFFLYFTILELFAIMIVYGAYQTRYEHKKEAIFLEIKNYSLSLEESKKFTTNIVDQNKKFQTYTLFEDSHTLYAYFPIPFIDDSLLKISYNKKEFLEFIKSLKIQLLITFLMATLIILLLSISFALYALKPLRKLLKQLEYLATYDTLTAIMNRRLFFEMAQKLQMESSRLKRYFYFVMLDIDHFKQVNDTYGHDVGDKVLQIFAKTIENQIRKSDIFGRIGGEEFALAFIDDTAESVFLLAEKIRTAIKEHAFVINEQLTLQITVSIGVVQAHKGEHMEAIMKRADEMLYDAKKSGRDRVMLDV